MKHHLTEEMNHIYGEKRTGMWSMGSDAVDTLSTRDPLRPYNRFHAESFSRDDSQKSPNDLRAFSHPVKGRFD